MLLTVKAFSAWQSVLNPQVPFHGLTTATDSFDDAPSQHRHAQVLIRWWCAIASAECWAALKFSLQTCAATRHKFPMLALLSKS